MFADDLFPTTELSMTGTDRRTRVLIVGGGIAALELVLALRVLAAPHVDVTVLAAEPELAPRAMTVATPFGRGGAQTHDWRQIAQDQRARLVLDEVMAVDTAERIVHTHSGRRMAYEVLVVATGARRVATLPGAVTFGATADVDSELRAVVADLLARASASVAFVLPSPSIWPLPLYEIALLAAAELREYGSGAAVRIVTPEQHPLDIFGAAAGDAVFPLLEALGVEFVPGAVAREVVTGGLRLADDGFVAADHVVAVAEIVARVVPGLPLDRLGFIPVDLHGRVTGEPRIYAAGEATSFPLRQGGLATQQADAVAEAIAAACGAIDDPMPFRPVLRGRMLTTGAPLYLQARPSGQSVASARALWSPPEKVAGRYLAPYLASARPSRIGAAPLAERVPADAGDASDAVTLARTLAEAEARCGNASRARQALEAARALEPDRERAAAHAANARPAR
jgi:sulfide:quinone oxidoreductase